MKIYGWTSGRAGACHRLELPLQALGRRGHVTASFRTLHRTLPADLDVLVEQGADEPARTGFWLELAADPGRTTALVADLDEQAGAALDDPRRAATLAHVLRAADLVTAATDDLRTRAQRFNPRVLVLPHCVGAELLARPRGCGVAADAPRAALTIGWFGGRDDRDDLALVRHDLRAFLRRRREIAVQVAGADGADVLGRLDAARVVTVSPGDAPPVDVAIVPAARRGDRAAREQRLLELAALGVPVVAAREQCSDAVRHGVTGLLVDHPHEWAVHLAALADDAGLRERLGAAARARAESLAVDTQADRWQRAFAGARRRRAAAPVD